jgi:hypothetical protein
VKHYPGKILAVLLVSAALLLPAQGGLAQNRVTRDPFAPPDLSKMTRKTVVMKRGKSPGEIIREEAAKLELRATIRNGSWAMANINGTMVEEGEAIEGFTLLRVGENEALLRKEGIEVILLMRISNSLGE